MSLYVRIILETLLQVFSNFQFVLRSISGTGKVDIVIIFNILGYPKIVSLDLSINKST